MQGELLSFKMKCYSMNSQAHQISNYVWFVCSTHEIRSNDNLIALNFTQNWNWFSIDIFKLNQYADVGIWTPDKKNQHMLCCIWFHYYVRLPCVWSIIDFDNCSDILWPKCETMISNCWVSLKSLVRRGKTMDLSSNTDIHGHTVHSTSVVNTKLFFLVSQWLHANILCMKFAIATCFFSINEVQYVTIFLTVDIEGIA